MRNLWLGALCGLLLSGCQNTGGAPGASLGSPGKLVTGRVDTAVILQADADYQKNAELYFKEQMALKGKYFDLFKAARDAGNKAKQESIGKEYQALQQKLDEKWKAKTQEFLLSRHDKLRTAAEAIAKEQKIDLVVVDSKQYPSVEYGATEITQEVLARLQGDDKAPATPQEKK